MREPGLVLAIEAAGGVGALARGLGISQPSVSGWTRVPAERIAQVERITGIARARLRPDLYATAPDAAPAAARLDETDAARAREYLLLATLLREPPSEALLDDLARLSGDSSPLGMAHIALADAAEKASEAGAGREYFNLFIGVGRGEILPYGSYYQTGFLNERPLASVREDLARIGIARRDDVYEPEDHIATLLEVMAGLIEGAFAGGAAEQKAFFNRHLGPFAARLFADIAVAEAAEFYRAVGAVGRAWIEIETEAFELPD